MNERSTSKLKNGPPETNEKYDVQRTELFSNKKKSAVEMIIDENSSIEKIRSEQRPTRINLANKLFYMKVD